LKKPAHSKLDSKILNHKVLASKAPQAHKVAIEKDVAQAALYAIDHGVNHHELPIDTNLNAADIATLKQLENDQAHWALNDNQDEATISIAYNDSIDSVSMDQPVADLYAFDAQWNQSQLESINAHISSSVNQAALPVWHLLLGGAVLGGVALAVSGGGGHSDAAPTDAQLFEAFCAGVTSAPTYIDLGNDHYAFNITSGFERSSLGQAASQSYYVAATGTSDESITSAGLGLVMTNAAVATVNISTVGDNSSDIIWLDKITVESSGSGYHDAYVNVTANAANSHTAEIGICDINIDLHGNGYGSASASGIVHINAYQAHANALEQIFVHDINVYASVSGYNGVNNPSFAYAEFSVAATAYSTGAQAIIEIGDVHLTAINDASYNHHSGYNYQDIAQAIALNVYASADSNSTIAKVSIDSISITASNRTGYGDNAAYVTMSASAMNHAISGYANEYSNSYASLDIGQIDLRSTADDYAGVILDGIGSVAWGTNDQVHVTIGDINMQAISDKSDASAFMNGNDVEGYAQSNSIATLSIGDISLNATAYDSARATFGSFSAHAAGDNAFVSITAGDMLIETRTEQGDGYSFFGGVGVYADYSNTIAEVSLGNITIISNGEADANAIVDGSSVTASGVSSYAKLSMGDITLTANANYGSGYAFYSVSANASNNHAVASVTVGNIEMNTQGYDNGYDFIYGLWSDVANQYSASVENAHSNVNIGNITMNVDSTDGTATARIDYIGATIDATGWHGSHTANEAISNSANIVVGNIDISAGKLINSSGDATAEIYQIQASTFGEDSLGHNNNVSVTIGDINLEARANDGQGYAGIESTVLAKTYAGTNDTATITIGDISVRVDSYSTASAYLGGTTTSSFVASADVTNSLAQIDVGNISVIANAFSDTGFGNIGGVYANANQNQSEAYISLGNIEISSDSYNSGYATFGSYGVALKSYADGSNSVAQISVGDIT